MKRSLAKALFATVALALAGTFVRPANAVIVERIVAVVGDRPILLSDLRHRARPFINRIAAQAQSPAQQAAQESEMYRELLSRVIDDRLEEQAADKARLVITPDEVDGAIRNVAAQAKVTVPDLISEVRRQGISEQDYRDEIRRQLIEGKLVQLRVRGRVRVTEQDARASYNRVIKEIGDQVLVDARLLPLRIQPGSTGEQLEARMKLARDLAVRARGGEDFCKLVKEFSDDAQTKDACGSRGALPINQLVPPIPELIKDLKPGEVAEPMRIGDEAILVVQLWKRSGVPTFEEMKDVMMDRAYGDALDRQKKIWLQELRRGVYLDIRM